MELKMPFYAGLLRFKILKIGLMQQSGRQLQ